MKKMKMKFTRYDIVRKKYDYQGEEFEEDDKEKDEICMILGIDDDTFLGYEIISLVDGNTEAWWEEDYLEFVRKGSREEYLSILKMIEAREEYQRKALQLVNQSREMSIPTLLSLLADHKERYTEKEFRMINEAFRLIINKELEQNENTM